MMRALWAGALLALVGVLPAAAQESATVLPFDALAMTPFGALPPAGPPMPASRNHHYLHYRVLAGRRFAGGAELDALAAGVDLQWLGGSVAGVTLGRQWCPENQQDCDSHAIAGLRGRLSLYTTGPTIGRAIHDYSATLMVAAEVGVGYAADVLDGRDACSFDIGLPVALGLLQQVRVVPFVTPALGWEMDCADRDTSTPRIALGWGISLQQIFMRGLDIHIGGQRVFRTGAGHQIGVGVTLVPLF
jgi:hypothetical protein